MPTQETTNDCGCQASAQVTAVQLPTAPAGPCCGTAEEAGDTCCGTAAKVDAVASGAMCC